MADRLTPEQFAKFGTRNIRGVVVRTATLDNDSISATDISGKVTQWNKITTSLFNKHPNETGRLRFPVVTLEVDNGKGYFDRGGTAFPAGNADFASATLRVVVTIDGVTWFDFTGLVKEPEYSDEKILRLVAEHPLTVLTSREWRRADRIGGDTGINRSWSS